MAAGDIVVVDGLNEAGLAGHLLVLSESDYGEPDEGRPTLTMAVWLQYMLDMFATVAEAVAWIEESQVQIVLRPIRSTDAPSACTWASTMRRAIRQSSSTSTGHRGSGTTGRTP